MTLADVLDKFSRHKPGSANTSPVTIVESCIPIDRFIINIFTEPKSVTRMIVIIALVASHAVGMQAARAARKIISESKRTSAKLDFARKRN